MYKIETEPIFDQLGLYRATLIQPPLLIAAEQGELPRETLLEFAFHQYSDSILWIPMLAQMKSRVTRSGRLRRAIEENIAHEAGLGAESHVTLAVHLMRSLGVRGVDDFPREMFGQAATYWLSDELASFDEPEIVDGDEHATWMAEAANDVVALHGGACVPAILAGMEDAWAETREVPDDLWRRVPRCASR